MENIVLSLMFLQQGTPMTFKYDYQVSTLEPGAMGTGDDGQPKQQTIVTGPIAATVPMEQLGTNGGGFFGVNFAHPYQSPTAFTNFLGCFAMMQFRPIRAGVSLDDQVLRIPFVYL
jgi:K+-transporting ATPase ATPase A chain